MEAWWPSVGLVALMLVVSFAALWYGTHDDDGDD